MSNHCAGIPLTDAMLEHGFYPLDVSMRFNLSGT